MTWTPTETARLKALRYRAMTTRFQSDAEAYRDALDEADPLARVEELELEVERQSGILRELRAWLVSPECHRMMADWNADEVLAKLDELEASHD